MKKKGIMTFVIALGFVFSFSGQGYAANPGKVLYEKLMCHSCHGKDGKGIICSRTKKNKKTGEIRCVKGEPKPAFEMYPKLAGQDQLYLFNQMKDIFGKKRTNSLSSSMYDTVVKGNLLEKSNVKDKDLKMIAKYLSEVKR